MTIVYILCTFLSPLMENYVYINKRSIFFKDLFFCGGGVQRDQERECQEDSLPNLS